MRKPNPNTNMLTNEIKLLYEGIQRSLNPTKPNFRLFTILEGLEPVGTTLSENTLIRKGYRMGEIIGYNKDNKPIYKAYYVKEIINE